MYWETGDEYGVGWYLKGRHRKEDLQLQDCPAAQKLLDELESLPMNET